jgi:hypothetical protein
LFVLKVKVVGYVVGEGGGEREREREKFIDNQ